MNAYQDEIPKVDLDWMSVALQLELIVAQVLKKPAGRGMKQIHQLN
jgi:hypothetical protein